MHHKITNEGHRTKQGMITRSHYAVQKKHLYGLKNKNFNNVH